MITKIARKFHDWSREDIAHMQRFFGCDERQAILKLQDDADKEDAEEAADNAYYEEQRRENERERLLGIQGAGWQIPELTDNPTFISGEGE